MGKYFFFYFLISEICHQLQKDDDEWCYFMRYGKPRRNHMIPDLSKGKNLVELSKPSQ